MKHDANRHPPLIGAAQLARVMEKAAADILPLDVRFDLGAPEAGASAFAAGHIRGAVYLHLDRDLSGPKSGSNGRHPLPDREEFAARMGALGVGPETLVVVYDAQSGMFAARLWWMLRWIGHARVVVLDGGLHAWQATGQPLATGTAPRTPASLPLREALHETVCTAEVLANLQGNARLVIDARAPDRYRGENETLDPVGGHIPGAVNRFFHDNLDADGRFLPEGELRAAFLSILGPVPVEHSIHQCGSGVTACHNLLAMEVAGLSGARLYPGSWSEWCADATRPVATGAAPWPAQR